jgi:hypothetical protein
VPRAFTIHINGPTHVIHHSCPAFHRDALKYSQHGEEDVIESNNAVLRTNPARYAVGPVRAYKPVTAETVAEAAIGALFFGLTPEGARSHFLLSGVVPFACNSNNTAAASAAALAATP